MSQGNKFCCLCGAPRKPTQAPVDGFSNNTKCVIMSDFRPIRTGAWEEGGGQMLVSVSLWRNGGSNGDTHICDDCVIVGLRHAKEFCDDALTRMGVTIADNAALETEVLDAKFRAARERETALRASNALAWCAAHGLVPCKRCCGAPRFGRCSNGPNHCEQVFQNAPDEQIAR